MKRMIALGAGVALSMVGFLAGEAYACGGEGKTASIKKITVESLATVMSQNAAVTVLDANGAETRSKYGVIPGAVMLSHYESFDPARELPADRGQPLVFYCGGVSCTAAPKAAMKAVHAGYTDVSVLEVGITGWAKAGQPVGRPATALKS